MFFLLASTVLVNTTMMVVFERTREIGTVGALGMKGREIVRMFFLEALALAADRRRSRGCSWAWRSPCPCQLLGIDMSSAMQGMSFEISDVVFARPRVAHHRADLPLRGGDLVPAALLPARRAARIQPVEALRAI